MPITSGSTHKEKTQLSMQIEILISHCGKLNMLLIQPTHISTLPVSSISTAQNYNVHVPKTAAQTHIVIPITQSFATQSI